MVHKDFLGYFDIICFLISYKSYYIYPCSWFYANVESLTEGKLDDREWILRSLNHRYFNNIIKNLETRLKRLLSSSTIYAIINARDYGSIKILILFYCGHGAIISKSAASSLQLHGKFGNRIMCLLYVNSNGSIHISLLACIL